LKNSSNSLIFFTPDFSVLLQFELNLDDKNHDKNYDCCTGEASSEEALPEAASEAGLWCDCSSVSWTWYHTKRDTECERHWYVSSSSLHAFHVKAEL